MSRSNPSVNTPNPSTRWFDWNGKHGEVEYYDKVEKKSFSLKPPFTFIYLDETATIKGWQKSSESGIYSNEVRDTRSQPFLVKSFKGGELVEGLYKDIKDRVTSKSIGGFFVANVYIAYKGVDGLRIGTIQFKGASLGAWMEFKKTAGKALNEKAVTISGAKEGVNGDVKFFSPVFSLSEVSVDTNTIAIDLDKELQEYFAGYFSRSKALEPAEKNTDEIPPPTEEQYEETVAQSSDGLPF